MHLHACYNTYPRENESAHRHTIYRVEPWTRDSIIRQMYARATLYNLLVMVLEHEERATGGNLQEG